ncbi:MAG: zinc ribbon domain-containing protein [Myxococcota bacterium]|nr:zinc ribbon domain-containing protein [Myxococcota bacterium]
MNRLERGSAPLLLTLLALVAGLGVPGPAAWAQAPQQVTSPNADVPKPPPGSGVILGQARVDENTAPIADLTVALYALRADGAPGLTSTQTDESGLFRFAGISTDPSVVYLVGSEYLGIPFAQRAVFEPGSSELIVNLALRKSIEDGTRLTIPEVTYKFDWVGGQLFVQVSHQIENPLDEVIYVAPERRDQNPALHAASLPEGISEYIDGEKGQRQNLLREGNQLSFWGPIYPGPQEVRYGFLLPGPAGSEGPDSEKIDIVDVLPRGAGALRVLLPADAPPPQGDGLGEAFEKVSIDGEDYASYSGAGLKPGDSVRLRLSVPESSNDLDALSLPRADFWVDHDDTAIRITAEVHVDVSAPARLLAAPGENLLELELPAGAEFLGLSGSTRLLGVTPNGRGGLAVKGPLVPGPSVIGYRYRVPVTDSARLDIQFNKPLDLLNVLIADNGVVIENDRLHRKRPFKQGTRFYLHREAYQVDPGELISVGLTPLERGAVSSGGAQVAAFAMAGIAALFLALPLRTRRTRPAPKEVSELTLKREILYESIRDLDIDFETGKIDEADFKLVREELRADAIALMRQEKLGETESPEAGAPVTPVKADPGDFCPGCGVAVGTGWSFCSACGHGLGTETPPE